MAELHSSKGCTGISETVASAIQSLFHEFSLVPLQKSINLVPQIHICRFRTATSRIQEPLRWRRQQCPVIARTRPSKRDSPKRERHGKHQMPNRSLPIRRDILPSNARLGCPVVAISRSKTELFNSTRLDCKIFISEYSESDNTDI